MRRLARSSFSRWAASGRFSTTTRCRRATRSPRRRRSSPRFGPRSRGLTTAKKLPEFRAQVTDLEGRLSNLRAVLPEEKDAADLLRRMQTVATQSNLTIKSFKPAPTVTKQLHAEWPIALELDGTYHNLATFFDRVGKFTRIVNISAGRHQGQAEAGAQCRRSPRRAWRRRSCCWTRRWRPSRARSRRRAPSARGEGTH